MPSKKKIPTQNIIDSICDLCYKREECDYFTNFLSTISSKSSSKPQKEESKSFSVGIVECEDFKKK